MLGDERGFDPGDETLQRRQMAAIGSCSSGERHADPVKRHRSLSADMLKHRKSTTSWNHVVFGMDFEPEIGGWVDKGFSEMLRLERYASDRSHRFDIRPMFVAREPMRAMTGGTGARRNATCVGRSRKLCPGASILSLSITAPRPHLKEKVAPRGHSGRHWDAGFEEGRTCRRKNGSEISCSLLPRPIGCRHEVHAKSASRLMRGDNFHALSQAGEGISECACRPAQCKKKGPEKEFANGHARGGEDSGGRRAEMRP